jgi:hypothetical protein
MFPQDHTILCRLSFRFPRPSGFFLFSSGASAVQQTNLKRLTLFLEQLSYHVYAERQLPAGKKVESEEG